MYIYKSIVFKLKRQKNKKIHYCVITINLVIELFVAFEQYKEWTWDPLLSSEHFFEVKLMKKTTFSDFLVDISRTSTNLKNHTTTSKIDFYRYVATEKFCT